MLVEIKRNMQYVVISTGICAVHLKQGSTETTYFLLKDYLGSSLKVVNSAGTTVEEHSYDPWGNHRNPTTWQLTDFTGSYRGYTGHEHLPQFALINMNGRMYDPIISRILTPDNFVQDETNAQNFNRYSYVINNPLHWTDPSGWLYDIDPTASGYKAALNFAKNNAAFKKIFNEWENDHTIMVKFISNSERKSTIGYEGLNEAGQNIFDVFWDPSMTNELGASGIFEESYHLKDAIKGKHLKFEKNSDGSYGTAFLDIYDEVRAKQWVVNNIEINDYYKIQGDYYGFTHYGYINKELFNDTEEIKKALMNGVGEQRPFERSFSPGTSFNSINPGKYIPSHFGGAYKYFSPNKLSNPNP